MKKCFKCGEEKPLTEFYKHSEMADGHLNKCKDCTKKDNIKNRQQKLDYYRRYDTERLNVPKRREAHNKRCAVYREDNPEKYAAHSAVGYAIKSGRLEKPERCESCGDKHKTIHAHHEDYGKPLEVDWLCPPCHFARHRKVVAI